MQVRFHRFQAYAAAEIAPTLDNRCSKPPQQICQGVFCPVAEKQIRVDVHIIQLPKSILTPTVAHFYEIYVTFAYCCKMSVSSPRRSLATLPRDHINGRCAGRWCIRKVLTCLDLFILFSAHLLLSFLGRTLGMVTALLLRPSLSTGPDCRPTGCTHILVTKGKSQAIVWKCVDQ